jgi:peptidoglycan-associated lipoprotein
MNRILHLLCIAAGSTMLTNCGLLGGGGVPMPKRDESYSFYGPGSERVMKGGQPTFNFAEDAWELGADESDKVEKLLDRLTENPAEKILIVGFANDNGTDEFNRVLGEERAQAVRNALIEGGIAADRLQTVSYGNEFGAKEGPAGRRVEIGLIVEA